MGHWRECHVERWQRVRLELGCGVGESKVEEMMGGDHLSITRREDCGVE